MKWTFNYKPRLQSEKYWILRKVFGDPIPPLCFENKNMAGFLFSLQKRCWSKLNSPIWVVGENKTSKNKYYPNTVTSKHNIIVLCWNYKFDTYLERENAT